MSRIFSLEHILTARSSELCRETTNKDLQTHCDALMISSKDKEYLLLVCLFYGIHYKKWVYKPLPALSKKFLCSSYLVIVVRLIVFLFCKYVSQVVECKTISRKFCEKYIFINSSVFVSPFVLIFDMQYVYFAQESHHLLIYLCRNESFMKSTMS
jgi:hypothetical protein